MSKGTSIRGRDAEIKAIQNFIDSRLESKSSGILYLTGPPGTGKTMSVRFVLDRMKDIPKISINCLKAQSSKSILTKICTSIGLEKYTNLSESHMTERIAKALTARRSLNHLVVLDEMDQLPKSKNIDLIRTIFGWPSLEGSKLILLGIANTVNLTSRYQTVSHILGKEYQVDKIVFRPYSTQDVKAILEWYLENDENFEDASVDDKALKLIAARTARHNGDIRSALDSLKNCIVDSLKTEPKTPKQPTEEGVYPTPPATPPPSTPCKERTTNMASVATSVKKRQLVSMFANKQIPFAHQITMMCIHKLCAGVMGSAVDYQVCLRLINSTATKFGVTCSKDDCRAILETLELQGLIGLKKSKPKSRVLLRASEMELLSMVERKNDISEVIDRLLK